MSVFNHVWVTDECQDSSFCAENQSRRWNKKKISGQNFNLIAKLSMCGAKRNRIGIGKRFCGPIATKESRCCNILSTNSSPFTLRTQTKLDRLLCLGTTTLVITTLVLCECPNWANYAMFFWVSHLMSLCFVPTCSVLLCWVSLCPVSLSQWNNAL